MAKRAVRTAVIVVVLPSRQRRSSMLERRKLGDVQALVAQPPVERFDQSVLDGLAGADEVELYPVAPCPLIQELRGELTPMINGDRPGQGALAG